jgi:hypothetical protein
MLSISMLGLELGLGLVIFRSSCFVLQRHDF